MDIFSLKLEAFNMPLSLKKNKTLTLFLPNMITSITHLLLNLFKNYSIYLKEVKR